MTVAALVVLIAVIIFAVEAIWHRSIMAGGLAMLSLGFLLEIGFRVS